MRFAVLGAGAIGGYVGAALARGGADVTLIARGPHLRAIQDNGIRVISERGDFTAAPQATDAIEAVADADVVFLGLKANSLTEIAPGSASCCGPAPRSSLRRTASPGGTSRTTTGRSPGWSSQASTPAL